MGMGSFLSDIAWPFAIFLAWLAGEFAYRQAKVPRISTYAFAGFVLAPSQSGFLPKGQSASILLLANIAFGLILFECGYRINLRWLRCNPWITVTSLTEALLTFFVVWFLSAWANQGTSTALLLAALSMASSPATIIRTISEQRSSGQVTERILHLSALNCVLAVFIFKIVVGLVVFKTSGNLGEAIYNSLIVLSASVMLGLIPGFVTPALLRLTRKADNNSTLAFTISIICLVILAHSLKLSPILVALTFGMTTRHCRIILSSSQRGFGALGDLLSVLLFVFVATTLEWHQVIAGFGLGLALVFVRFLTKILGAGLFSRISGISLKKGLLVGLGLSPISAFVILILEQTAHLGVNLVDQLAPLATAALTLEVLGPILVQRALVFANEVPNTEGQ